MWLPPALPVDCHAELARRVDAEEIALHDAVAHDVARRGRHTFVVERRAAARAQEVRLLAQAHVRREHLLAERVEQERRLAIQAAAGHRLHEEADEVGGFRRFEQHRAFERAELARAEPAHRALAGDAADFRAPTRDRDGARAAVYQ